MHISLNSWCKLLFYVEKDVRNMGVGTELLSLAMDGLKD